MNKLVSSSPLKGASIYPEVVSAPAESCGARSARMTGAESAAAAYASPRSARRALRRRALGLGLPCRGAV